MTSLTYVSTDQRLPLSQPSVRVVKKPERCDFLRHNNCSKCQTLLELRRDQDQGGSAGLSQLGGLSCYRAVPQQLLFDTVSVTLLRTVVETAVSGVHKLFRTGGVPTSLTLLFWRWLTVSSVFAGRSASPSCSSLPYSPPPFSAP